MVLSQLEHSRCAEGQEVWLFTKSVYMCEDKVDIYWCFLTLKISRTYLHFLFAYNLFSSILSHLRDLKFFVVVPLYYTIYNSSKHSGCKQPFNNSPCTGRQVPGAETWGGFGNESLKSWPPSSQPTQSVVVKGGGYIHTKKNWSYVQFVLSFQQKVFAELFSVFHVSIFWTHFSIILKAWVRLKLFSSYEFYCSFSVTRLLNTWH